MQHKKRTTFDIIQDITAIILGVFFLAIAILVPGNLIVRIMMIGAGFLSIAVGLAPMKNSKKEKIK